MFQFAILNTRGHINEEKPINGLVSAGKSSPGTIDFPMKIMGVPYVETFP